MNPLIQLKKTAILPLLMPLLLACFAAVFISSPTPAFARARGAVQRHCLGVRETLSPGSGVRAFNTRGQLRTREPLGSVHWNRGILPAPLRTRPRSL